MLVAVCHWQRGHRRRIPSCNGYGDGFLLRSVKYGLLLRLRRFGGRFGHVELESLEVALLADNRRRHIAAIRI